MVLRLLVSIFFIDFGDVFTDGDIMFWNFFKTMYFASFVVVWFSKQFSDFKFFVFEEKVGMFGFHVEVDAGIGGELLVAEADVGAWSVVWLLLFALALGAPVH